MSKVELLAPAGNYDCLVAAISAGADAVYLGGEKFGARAFAGNFTEEELVRGIHYAHLFGVRIFLTLNTLVKEKEFDDVYAYVKPFYDAGLDGVIIQDFGIFSFLQKSFPGLELHASTQMTITGVHGAKLLQQYGAKRIVPARELSLQDVKAISEECDIEIECFIHGAMCYCYSGQCLFSSMLGGRSGNRGRCAQPCRLPYHASIDRKDAKEERYPLSLKDMCTIEHIGELIDAGITSFKIEGRMKSAEYVFGVTSIYRKYIDLYEQTGIQPKIASRDLAVLNSLYIRSERHDGYYYKHNGKNMVSLSSPAYASCDDWIIEDLKQKMTPKKCAVTGEFEAKLGQPMRLSLAIPEQNVYVVVEGAIVDSAVKRPMLSQDFEKQLRKTGDTWFVYDHLLVTVDDQIFVPLKEINELRRQAFEDLKNQLEQNISLREATDASQKNSTAMEERDSVNDLDALGMQVLVTTKEQLDVATAIGADIEIILDCELAVSLWNGNVLEQYFQNTFHCILALPYIFRRRSEGCFAAYQQLLELYPWKGVLIRNVDEIGWMTEFGYQGQWILDAGIYAWNQEAKHFYQKKMWGVRQTVPYELTKHEMRDLDVSGMDMVVYGRIPLMVTANCIYKTFDQCRPSQGYREMIQIKDRKKKSLPVLANCAHCMNVIFNATPLCLFSFVGEMKTLDLRHLRLQFTTESADETNRIIRGFMDVLRDLESEEASFVRDIEHTNGHYKHGVD